MGLTVTGPGGKLDVSWEPDGAIPPDGRFYPNPDPRPHTRCSNSNAPASSARSNPPSPSTDPTGGRPASWKSPNHISTPCCARCGGDENGARTPPQERAGPPSRHMGTAEDWSGSGIGRPKPGEPYGDAHAGPEGSYSPVTACEAYSRQERDSTVATSIRAGRNLRISSRKASEDNTDGISRSRPARASHSPTSPYSPALSVVFRQVGVSCLVMYFFRV